MTDGDVASQCLRITVHYRNKVNLEIGSFNEVFYSEVIKNLRAAAKNPLFNNNRLWSA
jgi:hypothetical protein